MSDLIEREAALCPKFTLPARKFNRRTAKIVTETINRYSEFLAGLPSAQPERKEGKWVNDRGLYRCSNCDHIWSELWWVSSCPPDRMYKIMRFCPNCGAKMEVEE